VPNIFLQEQAVSSYPVRISNAIAEISWPSKTAPDVLGLYAGLLQPVPGVTIPKKKNRGIASPVFVGVFSNPAA